MLDFSDCLFIVALVVEVTMNMRLFNLPEWWGRNLDKYWGSPLAPDGAPLQLQVAKIGGGEGPVFGQNNLF